MSEYQHIENLINRDNNWLWILLSGLLLFIGEIYGDALTLFFGFTLFFTCFDVYGFHYLLIRLGKNNELTEANFNEYKIVYRILQAAVQILLLNLIITVSLIHENTAALLIAWLFTWWFGFCDYLFYKILSQNEMLEFHDMTWLSWTPYGIFLKLFKKPIEGKYLVFFSWTAFILSTIGIIYFEYL